MVALALRVLATVRIIQSVAMLPARGGFACGTTWAASEWLRVMAICPKSHGVCMASSYMALHGTHCEDPSDGAMGRSHVVLRKHSGHRHPIASTGLDQNSQKLASVTRVGLASPSQWCA